MDPEKTVPEEEIFAAGAPDEPEVDADADEEEEDEDLAAAENDPPDSGVGQPVEVEPDRQ
ncbi:MAG TPA: hypothetical protein VNW71_11985 [Thermoanaerobaculia bacterium]|jgi:hypothetical protein|nr:hypothetical protein [Thermoanaerobaculia bacterium]